jgi:hypothetical protein
MNPTLQSERSESPRVFNSSFETGVRAIFVLSAIYPDTLDLEELVAFDHLVVHSADVRGPNSLHPPTATRATEICHAFQNVVSQ